MQYDIIKIESTAEANKYVKVNSIDTLWTFCHDLKNSRWNRTFNYYYNDNYHIYILLRDDYKTVNLPKNIKLDGWGRKIVDKNYEGFQGDRSVEILDDFGLSMVAVLFDKNYELRATMTRYDKQFTENGPAIARFKVPVRLLNKLCGGYYKKVILGTDADKPHCEEMFVLTMLKGLLDGIKKSSIDYKKDAPWVRWNGFVDGSDKWYWLPLGRYSWSGKPLGESYKYYTFVDKDLNMFSENFLFPDTSDEPKFLKMGDVTVTSIAVGRSVMLIDDKGKPISKSLFNEIILNNYNSDPDDAFVAVRLLKEEGGYIYNMMYNDGTLLFDRWFNCIEVCENDKYKIFDNKGYAIVKYTKQEGYNGRLYWNLVDSNNNFLFNTDITELETTAGYRAKLCSDPSVTTPKSRRYGIWLCTNIDDNGNRVRNIFDYNNMRFVFPDWKVRKFASDEYDKLTSDVIMVSEDDNNIVYYVNPNTCEKYDINMNFIGPV